MKISSTASALLLILLPCALFARDFRDRIDGACTAGFTVHDGCEVKAGPAKEWGKTYTITPKGSRKFTLLLSVINSPEASTALPFIREQVAAQGKKMLERATERALEIKELKDGGAVIGYWYRLTDRNPRPEEYLYILQGEAGREKALITFTYLFNRDDPAELGRVMATVASARLSCDDSRRASLERLRLGASDIGGNCRLGEELIGRSLRIQHYYLVPGSYARSVPVPTDRAIQSIERSGDRGSVMLFKFASDIEERKGAFTGLFYGTDGAPGDDQPEEFIIRRDLMVIFCFERNSALGRDVKRVMMERLK